MGWSGFSNSFCTMQLCLSEKFSRFWGEGIFISFSFSSFTFFPLPNFSGLVSVVTQYLTEQNVRYWQHEVD